MQTRRYLVVFEHGPRNRSAFSPDVPGVIATDAAREQLVARMARAMALHLEGLADDGIPAPEPHASAEAGDDAEYLEVMLPTRVAGVTR